MMRYLIFVVVLLLEGEFKAVHKQVDYSLAVKWERRELDCQPTRDGKNTGKCTLIIGQEGNPPQRADCREEIISETDVRSICNIQCPGADRDSVISKRPNNNHRCIRFFTYNTEQDEQGNWYIWRAGKCRLEEIDLEVHCGFP